MKIWALFFLALLVFHTASEEATDPAFDEPEDDDDDFDDIPVEEETETDSDGLAPGMELNEENFDFEADVSRILDIIINSLYTHKEVFLRELISNASDALDKVRYKVLKDPTYVEGYENMEIKIEFDKEAKTLSI